MLKGYRVTGLQSLKSSRVQGFKGSRVTGLKSLKSSRVQGFKGSRVGGVQEFKGYRVTGLKRRREVLDSGVGIGWGGIKSVFELEDEQGLDGIGRVVIEAGITAGFPDILQWIDALDGRLVEKRKFGYRQMKILQDLVEMTQKEGL